MTLRVLHSDANVLVIHKPVGLAVHPGPRTPESLEDMLAGLSPGRGRAPSIVHRLDRDTGGCLCLARSAMAHRALAAAFSERRVEKTYLALLAGEITDNAGVIDAPLAKVSTKEDGWRMVVRESGKAARTHWRLVRRSGGQTLVEFVPETGRTHQLRVHATLIARGIVDDPVYAGGTGPTRLHAWKIAVPALLGAPAFVAVAEPPPEMDPAA
jgi:tRNA pseudouridine32 synthase/23S rRNA pseudouridine746 synthase